MLTRFSAILLSIALLLPWSRLFSQNPPATHYPDDSDWWSGLNPKNAEPEVTIQERELASANFRVLGIGLSEKMFDQASSKLGKTKLVQRGDASAGREQACYVSSAGSENVFLIFEQGEVDFTFYLFSDPRGWKGMDRCTPSTLISRALATASGLHLGQSPAEVIRILGKPSRRTKDELVYSLHAKKKKSAEDLRMARKNNPNMSDADFHSNFDFYDLGVGIDVKFSGGQLTFLAISKSETT